MEENKECLKCGINKSVGEFYKKVDGRTKDFCKKCINLINNNSVRRKKYREENKDKIKGYQKKYHSKYREENKDKIKEKNKKYEEKNKERVKEWKMKWYYANIEKMKEYNRKTSKFSTYAERLTIEEDPICVGDDELWCRCAYCREYYPVKNIDVVSRIGALRKGPNFGECRLYCSDKCKQECPIFGVQLIPKNLRSITQQARCNQSTNREMLLQLQIDGFDYNFCEVCGIPFPSQELYLHHNLMVSLDPKEANNMSHQILVCKEHHKHEGCI